MPLSQRLLLLRALQQRRRPPSRALGPGERRRSPPSSRGYATGGGPSSPTAGTPQRLALRWHRGGLRRGPPSLLSSPAPSSLPAPEPAAGLPAGRRYLLVQRSILGAAGGAALGSRHPLAVATLQHVHAGGPRALLALEVEEHVLVEGEPLLVPAVGFRRLLAQVAPLGAFLAGQQRQVQGVPLVVPHALLHGARQPCSPLGSLRGRSARRHQPRLRRNAAALHGRRHAPTGGSRPPPRAPPAPRGRLSLNPPRHPPPARVRPPAPPRLPAPPPRRPAGGERAAAAISPPGNSGVTWRDQP